MKSLQSILLLILFSASSILVLHCGKTELQDSFKNKLNQYNVFFNERHIAPVRDQQKHELLRSNNAEMRITRGMNAIRENERGSIASKELSTDREEINRGLFQAPDNSRILHFPLQPMDLIISPTEAALQSASLAAK